MRKLEIAKKFVETLFSMMWEESQDPQVFAKWHDVASSKPEELLNEYILIRDILIDSIKEIKDKNEKG